MFRSTVRTTLSIVLFTACSMAVGQDRKGEIATSQALRSRMRAALDNDRQLSQLVRETISQGDGSARSLKRLIDGMGKKQLPKYLEMFRSEIGKASKIERQSVVRTSKTLTARRPAILRLGRASYQLRDSLRAADGAARKAEKEDKGKNNGKRQDEQGPVKGPAEKKPQTFDDFLAAREQQLVDAWLAQRGRGEVTAGESLIINALNQIRRANRLDPLQVDAGLQLAAREHSQDMTQRGFFSHRSPLAGRRTYKDRAARYGTTCVAENIGKAESPQLVVRMWMNSGPHRGNIVNHRHTTIGVGIVGKKYTTMFGGGKLPRAKPTKKPGAAKSR